MKKIKIITMFLGVLCLTLLIILFSLLREKKKNFNLAAYHELFNIMSYNVKDELLNEYLGGEIGGGFWEEEVDSLYFHLDKLRSSDSYYDYFSHFYIFRVSETERINNILKSLDRYDAKEKEFVMAFLEFYSLQNMLKIQLREYYPFDRLVVYEKAFPLKGDTIRLGEEYVAALPIVVHNSAYKSTLVLDGDTLPVTGLLNTFSETPKKRGYVKKEGYITCFPEEGGGDKQLSVSIEYYVK